MNAHVKLAALRNRTEANGCTPGEVAAAQEAIARLLAKHPHLDQPEVVFKPWSGPAWNPHAAEDAIKAGMAKAAAEAAAKSKDAAYMRRQQKVRMWLDAMAAGKNVTSRLRAFARAWRAQGWSRSSYLEFCTAHQINRATAQTQWQRSQTQE